jgi:hypothetical protein
MNPENQIEERSPSGAATCSPFAEAAKKVEPLAPVTAEDLIELSVHLPPLEGEDAVMAIAMVAALCATTGRVLSCYPKAVASGIKRVGGAPLLIEACKAIAEKENMAEKHKAVVAAFGFRFTWSGEILSEPSVHAEVLAILANV